MAQKYLVANLHPPDSEPIRLTYLDHLPPSTPSRGTILLLHGFPQTSYQYRHVLPLFTAQGYRCIAPDYRGAGGSSRPFSPDFRKTRLAADMLSLLDYLGISEAVHVVGHDVGGMIAFALASRFPSRARSVCWGECPLPGTLAYRRDRTVPGRTVQQFHFVFHAVPDGLPEALVSGKERIYLQHFFDKISYNRAALGKEDVDVYVDAHQKPGAMRCALGVYRAFEEDRRENEEWVRKEGKCRVPTLVLSGERSAHREEAEEMVREVTMGEKVEVGVVEGAGHYVAEENPRDFVEKVLGFIERYMDD